MSRIELYDSEGIANSKGPREMTLPIAHDQTLGEYLNSTIATAANKRRAGNTVIWIGDSMTGNNGGIFVTTPPTARGPVDAKGMHNWANIYLAHDLEVIGNAGIGGQESSQIAARFDSDVLAYEPHIVGILAGSNDEPDDNTVFYLDEMYDKALAAGCLVVAQTIPPTTSATAGVEDYRLAVNEWIRERAATTPGIILADLAPAWQDPSLSGFKCVAAYTADGVHPSMMGAMVLGRVIADALRPFLPSSRVRATAAVAPYNLLSNPHFNGSGTADPSGWSVSGTGLTKSYIPRPDGLAGQAFQVVVPDGGSVSLTTNVTVDGSTLVVGDLVEYAIEVDCENVQGGSPASRFMFATLQQYNGSGFSDREWDPYRDGSYGLGAVPPDGTYGFRTLPKAVASGITLVQLVITIQAGGTYRFKGATLRNRTQIDAAAVAP